MPEILQTIQDLTPFWAYIFLFLSAFIENIFPPIPGDTVTVLGAYLVGTGALNFREVLLATSSGSVFGFMTIYGFAYWLEWKIIEKHQFKWVSQSRINQVEIWFAKYGYWIILFNRFFSGARSVISFVAGLSKMRVYYVFILAAIGGVIWNLLLIYLGSSIGKNWEQIVNIIKVYNRIVFFLLTIVILGIITYRILKKKKIHRSDPNSIK